jgi:Domain of unknown function (DUF4349)
MRVHISKARRWRSLVPVAAIAIMVVACSASSSSQPKTGGAGGSSGSVPDGIVSTTGSSGDVAVAPQPARAAPVAGGPDSPAVPSDLLIVKTGTLALQVTGIEPALGQASSKIAALGGYVSGSQRSGDGESAVARVTYRIPAARWDDALAALRGLADKVVAEQTQSAEVTGQVLDLGARIANLQATERALQAIMDKAIKISDVLDVQSQLTGVRGQIEQLETEKKHLEEQSAFGTLDVTYGLETVAVVAAQQGYDPAGEVDRATASLVQVGQALATAGIWFAILWLPVLLILGLLAIVAFVIVRRVRRNRPERPAGPVVPTAAA